MTELLKRVHNNKLCTKKQTNSQEYSNKDKHVSRAKLLPVRYDRNAQEDSQHNNVQNDSGMITHGVLRKINTPGKEVSPQKMASAVNIKSLHKGKTLTNANQKQMKSQPKHTASASHKVTLTQPKVSALRTAKVKKMGKSYTKKIENPSVKAVNHLVGQTVSDDHNNTVHGNDEVEKHEIVQKLRTKYNRIRSLNHVNWNSTRNLLYRDSLDGDYYCTIGDKWPCNMLSVYLGGGTCQALRNFSSMSEHLHNFM